MPALLMPAPAEKQPAFGVKFVVRCRAAQWFFLCAPVMMQDDLQHNTAKGGAVSASGRPLVCPLLGHVVIQTWDLGIASIPVERATNSHREHNTHLV